MTKRRKQGLILLLVSVPMMWFGFSNFFADKAFGTALAFGIAVACTLGLTFALSGLVMLVTKNSMGIWKVTNPDDKKGKTFDELTGAEKDARIASIEKEKAKGRGEDLLASQTKVGYSPIQKTINKPSKKVNEMAKASTSVELMKREKKLETRRKELESLLAEVTKEEKAVEKELKSKGWVQQKDGSWSVE